MARGGRTAAHFAAAAGHWELLQRLREAGADLDAADADGYTPHGRARRALAAAQDRRSKGTGDEQLATWLHRTLDELVASGARPDT